MKFQPLSAEEADSVRSESGPLKPGVYDFEVASASERVSKNGNDMIEMRLTVYAPDGSERTVFDYLLEAAAYKLRHAAEVCGLLSDYESGHLNAESFIGRSGRVKLGIETDQSGRYPDKNRVLDYVRAQPAPQQQAPRRESRIGSAPVLPQGRRNVAQELDDDVPF